MSHLRPVDDQDATLARLRTNMPVRVTLTGTLAEVVAHRGVYAYVVDTGRERIVVVPAEDGARIEPREC